MSRLVSNSIISAVDVIVMIVLSIISTPLLIDALGLEGYGIFVFLSIFSVFSALSFFDLGMEGALITCVAKAHARHDQAEIHGAVTIAVLYYGAIGILLGLLFWLCAPLLLAPLLEKVSLPLETVPAASKWVAVNIVLQFLTVPFNALLQGLQRFGIAKTISSSLNVVQYGLLIGVVTLYARLDIAFAVIAVASLLRLMVSIGASFRFVPELSQFRPQLTWGLAKSLSSYSSVLFLNRLVGLLMNQLDKGLIWLFLPVTSLAVYDVVCRPGNLIRLMTGFTYGAVIPEAARLHQLQDTSAIRTIYLSMIRYALLLIMPLVLWIGMHGGDILSIWIGLEMSAHAFYLPMVMGVFVLNVIPSIASTLAVGLELVHKTIRIALFGVLVNGLTSALCIQWFGLSGLFAGAIVGQLVMCIPYVLLMNRQLSIDASCYRPFVGITVCNGAVAAGHLALQVLLAGNELLHARFAATIGLMGLHAVVHYLMLLQKEERALLAQSVTRRVRRPALPSAEAI